MRSVRADKGRPWRIVNGRPRTETVRLTDDEYAAMAASLHSERKPDGLTRKERRREYVGRRKEEAQGLIRDVDDGG